MILYLKFSVKFMCFSIFVKALIYKEINGVVGTYYLYII
jgi:hypothetical protein